MREWGRLCRELWGWWSLSDFSVSSGTSSSSISSSSQKVRIQWLGLSSSSTSSEVKVDKSSEVKVSISFLASSNDSLKSKVDEDIINRRRHQFDSQMFWGWWSLWEPFCWFMPLILSIPSNMLGKFRTTLWSDSSEGTSSAASLWSDKGEYSLGRNGPSRIGSSKTCGYQVGLEGLEVWILGKVGKFLVSSPIFQWSAQQILWLHWPGWVVVAPSIQVQKDIQLWKDLKYEFFFVLLIENKEPSCQRDNHREEFEIQHRWLDVPIVMAGIFRRD